MLNQPNVQAYFAVCATIISGLTDLFSTVIISIILPSIFQELGGGAYFESAPGNCADPKSVKVAAIHSNSTTLTLTLNPKLKITPILTLTLNRRNFLVHFHHFIICFFHFTHIHINICHHHHQHFSFFVVSGAI